MNGFAFISLGSCTISFLLGNFVYYQNKRDSLNVIFAFYCLCMAYLAFAEFMYRQATSMSMADLWLKASALWPFNLALLLHFTLIFTGYRNFFKTKWSYFLIYIPILIFSITAFLLTEPIKEYWGYTYCRTTSMKIIGNSCGLSYGLLAFVLLLKYYFITRNFKKKQQTKCILLGQLFPTFAPIVTEGLLPTLNIKFPESIVASITIFAVFTVYAIWKYELFIINPATTAENIISTMPDSLILMDPDLKILEANQSLRQLLGYEKRELMGQPLDILLGKPEDITEKIQVELLSKGIIRNCEINYQTKAGGNIPVLFSGSVIKDRQGYIVGIVGIGSDIRAIKQLQGQLFQSEKLAAIGQLAGGVAHEINNPVGVILGFAQSIVKRISFDDPLSMPLKSIEREAIRCKKLIGDLLTFSRAGKTEAEPIDINRTIDETLSLITAQTKVMDIVIVKQFETGLPSITANKNQIQQVIVNLCNNAIDAMLNGGRLTILTRRDADQIIIKISDTGQGIIEAVKKHIFEPFFTTKDVGKGTGLGLSLCYEIMQKHHGVIEVESEIGKGTTFIIKLPEGRGLS